MAKKTWVFQITLQVDESWVADGFDGKERTEEIEALLEGLLPYAYSHEYKIKCKCVKSPSAEEVLKIQGY